MRHCLLKSDCIRATLSTFPEPASPVWFSCLLSRLPRSWQVVSVPCSPLLFIGLSVHFLPLLHSCSLLLWAWLLPCSDDLENKFFQTINSIIRTYWNNFPGKAFFWTLKEEISLKYTSLKWFLLWLHYATGKNFLQQDAHVTFTRAMNVGLRYADKFRLLLLTEEK